jgi:hypothetical protein
MFVYSNGTKYEGEWFMNKKEGVARFTNLEGKDELIVF